MTEKELIQLLKGQQLSEKALTQQTESYTATEKSELEEMLEHLQRQGIVGKHDSMYYLLKDQNIFLAKIIAKTHNFAILQAIPEDFEARISGEESDGLLLGDLVYAKEFQQGVYHCLDYYKPVTSLKGRYSLDQKGRPVLLVEYLNKAGKTILVSSSSEEIEADLRQGDLVEGNILSFNGATLKVKITKLLVRADDVGSDISMIIAENGAPLSFPESVVDEAKSIPQTISDDDRANRTDFRSHTIVTIDGEDAHDFDDAVEGRVLGNGYEVVVHIADVTEYVRPNHPLDDEAKVRGTSIYVADRVVPMLPFELSHGICSLNPNEDRLTLSVTMDVDAQGYVYKTRIERGIIRSSGRLTYSQVNAFFSGEAGDLSKEIQETLTVLHEASLAIRKRRTFQGAMRLDSAEIKYKLDEKGTPVEVTKTVQGESEKMIEDLMIITNCSVAKALKQEHIPVLYRVHEFPPLQKLTDFREFLKRLDLARVFPKNENITGARLNDFLNAIPDENQRSTVSYMMLRAMAKARYSPEELGHFGLAELEYCHFTSPIRRYPDDLIHRLVKSHLIDHKTFDYDDVYSRLENLGDMLSDDEQRANAIERDVNDLEAAKYMANHIGEQYHGKVVGMVQRGMFIETELGIEGFLSFRCMHGDYFHFNERYFEVVGEETDISFTIGTPIDIKVLAADPVKGEVDFATPEFYDRNAMGLSTEEKEDLALNGIHIYTTDDDYENEDAEKGAAESSDTEMNPEKELNDKEQNLVDAIDQLDAKEEEFSKENEEAEDEEDEESYEDEDRDFRPSPDQWKEVDIIRAIVARYPDDEAKVIEVLAVMDISEEEYRKLLRFTKPKEDRGGRGFGRRGGDRGGRGFTSHRGDRGGRSFGGRGERSYGDRSDRGERRGFGSRGRDSDRGERKFPDHRGYFSDRREDRGERRSYHDGERRGGFGGGRGFGGRGGDRGFGDRGGRGFGGRDSGRFYGGRGDRDNHRSEDRPSRSFSPRGGYGKKRRGE